MIRAVTNCLLNCQFRIPYFIEFLKTFLYCTILNAFSTGCLVVIGVSMKKRNNVSNLWYFAPNCKLTPNASNLIILRALINCFRRLHGKHGVGVPEPECRSRSAGVKFMEYTESKIWKTRSLT